MSDKHSPPFFPFFPEDFIHGCRYMDPLQKGIYIDLLCEQWQDAECKLTSNRTELLMRIGFGNVAGMTLEMRSSKCQANAQALLQKKSETIQANAQASGIANAQALLGLHVEFALEQVIADKFVMVDNGAYIRNERLYAERVRADEKIEVKRKSGRSGGRKSAQARAQALAQANAQQILDLPLTEEECVRTRDADAGEPASSATPGGALASENRREKPEPEPEPEPETLWPEQRHLDIDFWVEKLTETEGAEHHVLDAAINAGLDSGDAYSMEMKLILLSKTPLNRRQVAKGMVDHCKFVMDSPRYKQAMEAVA